MAKAIILFIVCICILVNGCSSDTTRYAQPAYSIDCVCECTTCDNISTCDIEYCLTRVSENKRMINELNWVLQ